MKICRNCRHWGTKQDRRDIIVRAVCQVHKPRITSFHYTCDSHEVDDEKEIHTEEG